MSEFGLYFRLGFEHISDLSGTDHILFVIALAAVYSLREWKHMLVLVTAFTIGHSVTLALATLGGMNVDADLIETLIENGFAVVGTPDDAIEQINRLLAQTGGFGKLLLPVNHWANARDTLQSYALFSRTVIAHFKSTGPSSQ